MVCVIVNHSRMSSVLSWFSYERFWVVTAAEVFVILSGIVLGMVYGRRLLRDGWRTVASGLGRRVLLLYGALTGVTVSLIVMSMLGINVSSMARNGDRLTAWLASPASMDVAAWRDLLMMRTGPWAFEIIAMYVWLVAAAVPCLLALRYVGWQPVLLVSWIAYAFNRVSPHRLTGAEFETVFPLLAWQLLFVHGITIGYHRERFGAWIAKRANALLVAAGVATGIFLTFALCNPWVDGPSWLRVHLVSPDTFSQIYVRYFGLSELGVGRLANLAVALPVGYVLLGRFATLVRPIEKLLATLGQRSLGAFVLHVYALVLFAHLPRTGNPFANALLQMLMVVGIAGVLRVTKRRRVQTATPSVDMQPALAA